MARSPKRAQSPEALTKDTAAALGALAQRGEAIFETSLRTWGEEVHGLVEGMARDGAEAFEKLQACRSPMDVIAVEQAWLAARSKAYMEAGRRWLEAGLKARARPGNETRAFHLPD